MGKKAGEVLEKEFSVQSPENFYGIPPCKDALVIKNNA